MNGVAELPLDGLQWQEHGCAALSGTLLQRARQLDAVFLSWAAELDAADYEFPSLIAAKDLAPIGWLGSFPHLASFVTYADRDPAALRALAAEHGHSECVNLEGAEFSDVSHLLTPATCYHIYPQFAGQTLPAPTVVTAVCQCHRREDRFLPLQRQWGFRMREIVCLGDADSASELCAALRERVDALTAALGIAGNWQTASDPFFDPAGDSKALAQMLEPSKLEFCTRAGLAIASINEHRSFFGECYEIRHNGAAAASACVAFGIERWLHALYEAHGPDPVRWPNPEVAL